MTSNTQDTRFQILERLLEVSRNLSATLELDPLLQSIVDTASELTFSEAASILLHDEETDQLLFTAAPWFQRKTLKSLQVPLEGSVAGEVFTTGETLVILDAKSDPLVYRAVEDALEDFNTRSILAVPLKFKEKTVGVLEAINKKEGMYYNEEDINVLETLASQAAIAIQNAKLMEEAQRAYKELAELDEMKTDFIAITSHELRTPLGLILGHATFLSEMVSEDFQPQMEVIVRSSMRLKDIIEDLSKVDNFQTGMARVRRRKIPVGRIVEEVIESFTLEAKQKNIALASEIPEVDLTIEGEVEKISIAVSNLLKNAITFTDEGGKVLVTCEQMPGFIKVSVTDNGVGIPAKDLKRIFERFYQVESHLTRRHGGMGLGLSVAKVMVELHGGQIWAESVEGKGSNFIILLPINASQASAVQRVFTT